MRWRESTESADPRRCLKPRILPRIASSRYSHEANPSARTSRIRECVYLCPPTPRFPVRAKVPLERPTHAHPMPSLPLHSGQIVSSPSVTKAKLHLKIGAKRHDILPQIHPIFPLNQVIWGRHGTVRARMAPKCPSAIRAQCPNST